MKSGKTDALSLRGLPAALMNSLRRSAERDFRSVNQQIISLLTKALSHPESPSEMVPDIKQQFTKTQQLRAWRKLASKWEDPRTTAEIIEEIYSQRTMGREVKL